MLPFGEGSDNFMVERKFTTLWRDKWQFPVAFAINSDFSQSRQPGAHENSFGFMHFLMIMLE